MFLVLMLDWDFFIMKQCLKKAFTPLVSTTSMQYKPQVFFN